MNGSPSGESSGVVFDIKRFAIHDGPGIRTTVFLKGCPLQCRWCHNPEGMIRQSEFMWWQDRCLGCRDCKEACPHQAITFTEDVVALDHTRCDLCGACVDACHSQALELIGKKMSVPQVMQEVEKDLPFYEESGGGVTFSGGEPLMQPEFLQALLKACKQRGIHTTVDTSGYAETDVILALSEFVDLFLFDLKIVNNEKHRQFTGVSNEIILDNLRKLSEVGQSIIVRHPIIPGVNDTDQEISEVGAFVASLKYVKELSLLPYHQGGIAKSKRLINSKASIFKVQPPPAETVNVIADKLRAFGLTIRIGG